MSSKTNRAESSEATGEGSAKALREDLVTSNEGANPARSHVFAMFARVVLGVAIGIVAVDVLVGSYSDDENKQGDRAVIRLDPELGWTNTPGYTVGDAVRINSVGLRGPEIPEDAPPTEVRILVTGASNTYGLAERDEDTWRPRLEALLADELSPPPRVLNGGVQGYSIVQSTRRAARLIDRLDPDLVVVVVIPSRQAIIDTSPALNWTRVGGDVVPTSLVEGWPGATKRVPAALHKLLMHSNLYRRYRALTQLGQGVGPEHVEFMLTNAEPPEIAREPLERTREEIGALVELAESRGIELRFAIAVETRGANPEQWPIWLEGAAEKGAPPVGTPMDEPFDALTRFVESAGGEAWDMRATLYRMCADWEANVNAKLHWSGPGHAMIAEDWARRITEGGLLEELAASRAGRPREAAVQSSGLESMPGMNAK